MELTIKKDEETGEYYLDFEELSHLFRDPSCVDSYLFEEDENGSIILQFFDKHGNIVKPRNTDEDS